MKKILPAFFAILMAVMHLSPVAQAQPLCQANFQYVIGQTTPNGTMVSFYDSSFAAGTITNWSWTFSTGQVSTLQNPVITVQGATSILACLTITAIFQNQTCTSTYCDTIQVNGGGPTCNPSFTYSVNPQGVAVFAAAPGTNISWQWSFGDGTGATGANATHTYSSPGTYQVCLTVVDANGTTCSSCQTVVVGTALNCNAAFTYSTIPGTVLIQFTNQSTGNATNFLWSFGDGTSSTLQNPTHVFNGTGPYMVCLTISDSTLQCYDTYCDSLSFGSGQCQAGFNFTVAPLSNTATFTNTSTGPTGSTYIWDFGDGTTSTQQSPTHTYAAPGNYIVCLTIVNQNALCYDTQCATVIVSNVLNCQASFTWSPNPSGNGIQFTSTSTGNPTNYSWNFGNGTTSTLQNPVVNFGAAGWYNVCLSIWVVNGSCQSTYCDTVYYAGNNTGCSSNFALYPDTLTPHNYFAVNLATGVGPLTYVWSWGDGTSSTGAYPSHTYAGPGLYTICLTITDATGCTSTTCYQWQLLRLSGVSTPVTINVISGTTGIQESGLIQSVSVYPNPASDFMQAGFSLVKDSEVTINIMNLAGQKVLSLPSTYYVSGDHEIGMDISKLASGMYLIEIQSDDFRVHKKVVIQ